MSATQLALPDDRRPLYTVPAIPTTYDGVRYDSRHEARRVPWMNHLGLRFYLSPSRPTCRPQQMYEADFMLLDYRVFVEIKPYFDVAFLERYPSAGPGLASRC